MGAKSFKQSKAPTNKIRGGLDAIVLGGIYATDSGKGRRNHKKNKRALQPAGGKEQIQNDWYRRVSTIKTTHPITGEAGKHTVVLVGATVVGKTNDATFKCVVNKQKVTLGDESTYTSAMIAIKNEEKKINPQQTNMSHKCAGKVTNQNNHKPNMIKGPSSNGHRINKSVVSKINYGATQEVRKDDSSTGKASSNKPCHN